MTIVMGVRSACLRAGRSVRMFGSLVGVQAIKVINENCKKEKAIIEAEVSIRWRGVVDGSALIGSHSPSCV